MKKLLAVIALSFALTACGDATLDMSSQQAAQESIAKALLLKSASRWLLPAVAMKKK